MPPCAACNDPLILWNPDFRKAAGRDGIYSLGDESRMLAQVRPLLLAQNRHCNSAMRQVLLLLQIFVSGEK
jgi:hypothetical protein